MRLMGVLRLCWVKPIEEILWHSAPRGPRDLQESVLKAAIKTSTQRQPCKQGCRTLRASSQEPDARGSETIESHLVTQAGATQQRLTTSHEFGGDSSPFMSPCDESDANSAKITQTSC